MAFMCDTCYKRDTWTAAPFVIEDVGVQKIIACCSDHLAAELLSQLKRGARVMVRRGEIEGSAPDPPRPPA